MSRVFVDTLAILTMLVATDAVHGGEPRVCPVGDV